MVVAQHLPPVLPTLTEKQENVLLYIAHYFATKRDYPTQREMASYFQCQQNAVRVHLEALQRKGYIEKEPGKRRNMRLTALAMEKLARVNKEDDQR